MSKGETISLAISGEAEMELQDKTDPGACRHGNFMNYYQFHPAEERLHQLPQGVWHADAPDRKYIGIDVGCNAGDLTLALYDFLEKNLEAEVSLLGVDLDPLLIERARENSSDPRRNVTYKCVDFMSEERTAVIDKFLAGMGRDFFDVAFCFSITMWIHLNHGDSGLVQFLRSVCEKTRVIVVEPQPWRCYRTASRRLRRANVGDFPLINSLNYKHDMDGHVGRILSELCGFEKVTETRDNEWGRKLLVYKRKHSNCTS